MNRKIYLVRHGKIDIGKEKRYIGVTDLPLSIEGIIQSQQLKKFFSNIYIEKAYISPLKRCIQTANIILANRNIEKQLIEEFMEINMGQWEGKSFRYIKNFFPEEFKKRGENIDTFVPVGGESFQQLQKRVVPVLEDIIKKYIGNILIIAHAGVNRVILSNILSIPLYDIFKINQEYGCVNELSWDEKHSSWLQKEFVYDNEINCWLTPINIIGKSPSEA